MYFLLTCLRTQRHGTQADRADISFSPTTVHRTAEPASAIRQNTLKAGGMLYSPKCLSSNNGNYFLCMQNDQNVVLYRAWPTTKPSPLWSGMANTAVRSTSQGSVLALQGDCNLVAYQLPGKVLWATNTEERGTNCFLRVFNNGNLVLFDGNEKPIWTTNTRTDGC